MKKMLNVEEKQRVSSEGLEQIDRKTKKESFQ